jgi:uncharacterized membrane protein (UPF0127 family)
MVLVACAPVSDPVTSTAAPVTTTTTTTTTTAPPTTTTTAPSTTTTTLSLGDLTDWEVGTVVINGVELLVAVADTPGERAQGLMGVEDLGSLAGMLFVYESDSEGGFWMKDTIIPLDIAFFAADGSLVSLLRMEPCHSDPCPLYYPGAAYRFALETPAGDLADLGSDATLVVP